ncbi:MAG TPA: DUF4342 domain-containing protein [Halanaerobiales bacterium]|nr:DUF4342 domain-containing protein [Halanaerobiales bacterium]
MEKLEKIDIIKKRLDVSYNEANQALEDCDGDVVAALIHLEENMETGEKQDTEKKYEKEKMNVMGNELMDKLREIIKEGNVKKITVKNDKGESILEIPVTAGVVGLVLFPYIGILGGMAAMLKEYKLEITKEKEKQEEEDLN